MEFPQASHAIALKMSSNQPSPANPSPTATNRPPLPAVPAVVDQYRLLRLLGRGSTGIVCEAEDTALGRRVAIKLIPQQPTSDLTLPQIPREALLASEVQ